MYLKLAQPVVPFESYLPLITPQLADDLKAVARDLGHLRVVHLNSTAFGGGVAEILQSLVPLMNSLGIATERVVIDPEPEFFKVTKRIHNLLQGAEGTLSAGELDTYFGNIQRVADEINQNHLAADVWFLHDPQLLPLARLLPRPAGQTWLWVCHIDLTSPNKSVLDTLMPLARNYDQVIVSLPQYAPKGLDIPPVSIVPPAIDPLTTKNDPLGESEALSLIAAMGIDPDRPLMTQVSRFDPWKDPQGVIDAYRLARRDIPGLQLALLGLTLANDDPEALEVLASVTEHAAGDPDIHLYFDPNGLPCTVDCIVNAFQVASKVILQKSTREGFGLTVSEAMWKGASVIGGNVGGIRVQIEDGVNGYLVDSPEECGQRVVQLIQDPGLRARMGEEAKKRVRKRFLLPRLALDYLQIVRSQVESRAMVESTNGRGHNGLVSPDSLPQGALVEALVPAVEPPEKLNPDR
jgi:trehalose synthase